MCYRNLEAGTNFTVCFVDDVVIYYDWQIQRLSDQFTCME